MIKPGKHLLIGPGMKSITGSRKVIDILNRLGHSISYHLTEEFETRLASEISDKNYSTPDGLSMNPGLATALAWDNFDENIETMSGDGTVHDTVGICYQNIVEHPINIQQDCDSARSGSQLKKKKQASRAFYKSQKVLEPYRKKPRISKFDYAERKIERPLNVTKTEWRDILWMLSMKLESAPLWTGWNCLVTEDQLPLQRIGYMENINHPPTQLDVIVETLCISQKVAEECGEKYAIVTYDLAIAKPALQIQSQESPTYDNVFICFGAFHISLAYFGCLGNFVDGSGGPNILTESGVLAPGSLRGFLLGKHYNRCKRLHPLLACAFQSLHFNAFLEMYGPLSEEFRHMLHEINLNPSPLVLEAFEKSPQYTKLMTDYQTYCDKTLEGSHDSTQKFWMMYVCLVEKFMIFNRACRTNDIILFIYALEQIIPVLFAGNRPNYSRWMVRYHLNLLNAENTHPGVMNMLKDGAFSVRRTKKPFSRTPVDMTLEQTVNADAASRHTGMGAFAHLESARKRWMMTRSIRSAIVSQLLLFAGLVAPEDVTKDLKKHRVLKDNEDFQRLVDCIQSTMNPFELDNEENLYCLTSGQRVSEPIKEDLLTFITNGEKWSEEFREACFQDPSRFEKPIPRRKIKNFASASVTSKIPAKNKVQEVRGTRDLFGRLLLISTMENINLSKVLEYPLTPVPLSLAHSDGSINTTGKAKLMHKLEDLLQNHSQPSNVDVYIVDATFLLHIQQSPPMTFAGIARSLICQLTHMAQHTHLVCDVYNRPSIKDAERMRRGSEELVYCITGPEQNRPKNWQAALKSPSFKTGLMHFLATEWKKPSYAGILANNTIYLAVDDICHCFTASGDNVTCIQIPALVSFHEEADTRMAFHLNFIDQFQEAKNVCIRTNDTDVLVIFLYHLTQGECDTNVWLDVGLNSNNTRRFISINDLVPKIGRDVVQALPGIHAFTGCDYTASFHGKGKVKPFDLLRKHEEFKSAFAEFGNGPLSDETVQACEKFTCHMYGKTKLTKVNDVRFAMFQEAYSPKQLDDPLNSIKGINPSSMPPCSNVLRKKMERANYVARMWKRASSQLPNDESPGENGWVLDSDTYRVDWYDCDQLPTDIYKVLELSPEVQILEESEDEEVMYGENIYGPDEPNDYDYI